MAPHFIFLTKTLTFQQRGFVLAIYQVGEAQIVTI